MINLIKITVTILIKQSLHLYLLHFLNMIWIVVEIHCFERRYKGDGFLQLYSFGKTAIPQSNLHNTRVP